MAGHLIINGEQFDPKKWVIIRNIVFTPACGARSTNAIDILNVSQEINGNTVLLDKVVSKIQSELERHTNGAAHEWSTVVSISITPPSFKPVLCFIVIVTYLLYI